MLDGRGKELAGASPTMAGSGLDAAPFTELERSRKRPFGSCSPVVPLRTRSVGDGEWQLQALEGRRMGAAQPVLGTVPRRALALAPSLHRPLRLGVPHGSRSQHPAS